MTLTAHSLVAAAIITKIPDPIIGLPLIFVSHFVLDKAPHWDVMTQKNKTRAQIISGTIMDICLGFVLGGSFVLLVNPAVNPIYFFVGVALSQLPDWLEMPHVFPSFDNPISRLSYRFQHWVHDLWFNARMDAPWGIVTQAAVVLLFLLWGFS